MPHRRPLLEAPWERPTIDGVILRLMWFHFLPPVRNISRGYRHACILQREGASSGIGGVLHTSIVRQEGAAKGDNAGAPTGNPPAPASAASAATSDAPANAPAQAGSDRPVIVVPATSDAATVTVLLRGLDAEPRPSDIEAGLLTSAQQPNLLQRPSVALGAVTGVPNKPGEFSVELTIRGIVTFGESSAPVLYKGKQIESLRFSKPGLAVKPASEGDFVAREGSTLPLVLENPSGFEYKLVRARLRFANKDVCAFHAESFSGDTSIASAPDETCENYEGWTRFAIPRYAQVTLRAVPAVDWFRDPDSGFARSGKQKGRLTLRFQAAAGEPIHEQNLPWRSSSSLVPGRCSRVWRRSPGYCSQARFFHSCCASRFRTSSARDN